MRTRRDRVGVAAFLVAHAIVVGVLAPRSARAGEMDPTPERLVEQPANLPPGQTCQSIAADPQGVRPQDFPCRPNNLAFRNMISELGFAIAPSAFYPARTTGIGGFQVTLEASYTKIHSGKSTESRDGARTPYWELGTRGGQDSTTNEFSGRNSDPASLLQIYAIKARKGLPLGFEIAGSFGYVANTTLWVGGGDIRWSFFEGFRKGVLGYLPDVSLGAGVRTLTGTSRFYLTTVGIDVRVSKPFTLLDTGSLIPSLGYQRLLIFGDSNVVDGTPQVDAAQQCGYQGVNENGSPICRNKLPGGGDASHDFGNNFTFDRVRIHRNRGLIGLNYRYEIVWVGSQFAFDIDDPRDDNPGIVGKRQWTLSFEGGVHF